MGSFKRLPFRDFSSNLLPEITKLCPYEVQETTLYISVISAVLEIMLRFETYQNNKFGRMIYETFEKNQTELLNYDQGFGKINTYVFDLLKNILNSYESVVNRKKFLQDYLADDGPAKTLEYYFRMLIMLKVDQALVGKIKSKIVDLEIVKAVMFTSSKLFGINVVLLDETQGLLYFNYHIEAPRAYFLVKASMEVNQLYTNEMITLEVRSEIEMSWITNLLGFRIQELNHKKYLSLEEQSYGSEYHTANNYIRTENATPISGNYSTQTPVLTSQNANEIGINSPNLYSNAPKNQFLGSAPALTATSQENNRENPNLNNGFLEKTNPLIPQAQKYQNWNRGNTNLSPNPDNTSFYTPQIILPNKQNSNYQNFDPSGPNLYPASFNNTPATSQNKLPDSQNINGQIFNPGGNNINQNSKPNPINPPKINAPLMALPNFSNFSTSPNTNQTVPVIATPPSYNQTPTSTPSITPNTYGYASSPTYLDQTSYSQPPHPTYSPASTFVPSPELNNRTGPNHNQNPSHLPQNLNHPGNPNSNPGQFYPPINQSYTTDSYKTQNKPMPPEIPSSKLPNIIIDLLQKIAEVFSEKSIYNPEIQEMVKNAWEKYPEIGNTTKGLICDIKSEPPRVKPPMPIDPQRNSNNGTRRQPSPLPPNKNYQATNNSNFDRPPFNTEPQGNMNNFNPVGNKQNDKIICLFHNRMESKEFFSEISCAECKNQICTNCRLKNFQNCVKCERSYSENELNYLNILAQSSGLVGLNYEKNPPYAGYNINYPNYNNHNPPRVDFKIPEPNIPKKEFTMPGPNNPPNQANYLTNQNLNQPVPGWNDRPNPGFDQFRKTNTPNYNQGKTKMCEIHRQQVSEDFFSKDINCPDQCSICNKCRTQNRINCLICNREYSENDKDLLEIFAFT